MENVYVGIDLGTTTTLIASAKSEDNIRVLDIIQEDKDGEIYEASYLKSLAYFPDKQPPFVGTRAEFYGQQDASRFVRAVKRQMGRRILLPVVEKEPYQVSALYLEKALHTAKRKLSGEMVFTVTVPASFTSNQRADTLRALKEACENTGVPFPKDTNEIFISEPVAAALAFLHEDFHKKQAFQKLDYTKDVQRIIIYDIGGGTTDLTLIYIAPRKDSVQEITDLQIRVEEISYYNPFGGEDFDLKIAEFIYYEFLKQNPGLEKLELNSTERLSLRLQFSAIAKDLKERLSNNFNSHQVSDNPFAEDDEDNTTVTSKFTGTIRLRGQTYNCSGEMSWEQLRQCVYPLLHTDNRRGVIAPLRSLLAKRRFSVNEIDGLLLVGGMARFPLIEEVLKGEFGESKVWVFQPPDHAVVRGAALYSYFRTSAAQFTLEEPASDAYYVKRKEKGFDLILPSQKRTGEKKKYVLDRDVETLVIQVFSGEEAQDGEEESMYHTLIYQGGVTLHLGKQYPKGTPVWVRVAYDENLSGGQSHSKLPWLFVWINDENGEPQKIHYSEIFNSREERS